MPLEIRHLDHTYSEGSPFEFKALKDINLNIEDGQFVGLIGHTGSGKSTLIQHLNGLLQPTGGTVLFNGADIFTEKKEALIQIRHKIGLVFQYPEHQLFEETVEKDVSFGPKNLGLDEAEISRRVKHAIKMVGLNYEKVKDKSPFELSGGQMRRVAIAGVLAMDPDVLILDEPTAGLDPSGRDEILNQIKTLHEKKKITVILVSHSMEDIGRTADRVLVMNRGKAAMLDETKAVFAKGPQLEEMGLRVPQITKIMQELEKMGLPVDPSTLTVDDALHQLIPIFKRKEELR